jgi:hypothetical protein
VGTPPPPPNAEQNLLLHKALLLEKVMKATHPGGAGGVGEGGVQGTACNADTLRFNLVNISVSGAYLYDEQRQ